MSDTPWEKDPGDSNLDFQIDWSEWLNDGDTISSSSWSKTGSVTIDNDTNSTTTATVWLSGGAFGEVCELTNAIVTAGGRTVEQTKTLNVFERKS